MRGRRPFSATVILAILATGCGGGPPDRDDLRALAEALARRNAAPTADVGVRVGALSGEAGELLPLPPEFRVLGSSETAASARVHAMSSLASDSARTLLARALVSAGWETGAGGTLCHPEGWSLLATADPNLEPLYAFVLELAPATGPPCGPDPGPTSADRLRVQELLPRPPSPPARGDTELRCRGVNLTGTVRPFASELSADSVLALYGRTMEAAGWQEAEEPTASEAETWERDDGADGRLSFTIAAAGAPGSPECLTLTFVHAWAW